MCNMDIYIFIPKFKYSSINLITKTSVEKSIAFKQQ